MTSESLQQQIDRYESFGTADPSNTLIWNSLGDLYHSGGMFDQAESCFQKSLVLEPENQIAKGRLANVAISRHDFAKAEELIKSLPDHEENTALLSNLGIALCHQEKWQEARDVLAKSFAKGVTREDLSNFKYLIYAYHHCEQEPEAIHAAHAWHDMDESTEARGLISLLEMDLGDMQTARDHAQDVLKRDPKNPNANAVIGYWRAEQQEIDESRRHFQSVIAADPQNERGWQGLGLAFMYDQNFPEAIKCFKRFEQIQPANVTNYIMMGWCAISLKNAIEAEKYFRQAIETDRTFSEAHGGLASALVMQNRQEEARDHIQKARALDPEGFGAVFAHSILLTLQGKETTGKNMFAKMMMRTPEGGDKPLIENLRTFFVQQEAKRKQLKRLTNFRNKTKH